MVLCMKLTDYGQWIRLNYFYTWTQYSPLSPKSIEQLDFILDTKTPIPFVLQVFDSGFSIFRVSFKVEESTLIVNSIAPSGISYILPICELKAALSSIASTTIYNVGLSGTNVIATHLASGETHTMICGKETSANPIDTMPNGEILLSIINTFPRYQILFKRGKKYFSQGTLTRAEYYDFGALQKAMSKRFVYDL